MTKKKPPMHRGEMLLARFLDYSYESRDVKASHIALYAHILTTYNKLGWPEEFALPTDLAMMRAHISNRKTYYRLLDNLIQWGWVKDCGRNGRECRRVSILEGSDKQAYARALQNEGEAALAQAIIPEQPTVVCATEQQPDEMNRFDLIFDNWVQNVKKDDKRWVEAMARETGIKNYELAMSLYKEHIIRNSKVSDWINMSLREKKTYFINSARFFATSDCKIVKEVVAKVITLGGKPYVEQYGMRIPLPCNYTPQPDVNYYWDEIWGSWRMS